MQRFFKGTEEQSFRYPIIVEERKGSRNYLPLIIGGSLLALVVVFFLFLR